MDAKFQPSFIPKQPLVAPRAYGSYVSMLYVIALVLFVVTLGLVGAVFITEHFLKKDIDSLNQSLIEAKSSFEIGTILELQKTSARTMLAESLLNKHIAVSKFLDVLGPSTFANVSFSAFSSTASNGTISVNLSGLAGSYNSLILQTDYFATLPFLRNPKFSNFSPDDFGNVSFSFTANIDPLLVNYSRYITE